MFIFFYFKVQIFVLYQNYFCLRVLTLSQIAYMLIYFYQRNIKVDGGYLNSNAQSKEMISLKYFIFKVNITSKTLQLHAIGMFLLAYLSQRLK